MIGSELQAQCAERRQRLLADLPADALVLLSAAPTVIRNGDVHYPYRQDSYFWYLTGYPETDAMALLVPGSPQGDYLLFNQPGHHAAERWSGKTIGPTEAKTIFQADAAFALDVFPEIFAELLLGRQAIYFALEQSSLYQLVMTGIETALQSRVCDRSQWTLHHVSPLLDEMRLIKSDYEIQQMQRAVDASVLAHRQAMQSAQIGHYEYHLEASILNTLVQQGCRSVAYPCIVGSGPNACVLHYQKNYRQIQQDDLILVDAGGEYAGYAADITRTFPASGRFTAQQRDLYQLVLQAQQAAIDCIEPNIYWDDIQTIVVRILTTGLVDLGLLTGTVDDLIATHAYLEFYMHQASHWLGLDVHDVGAYQCAGQSRVLQPGMVLTVEPGLYIEPNCQSVDPMWRGLGIRIEDDILVTNHGAQVLSAALPKTLDAVEQLVRHGL